DVGLGGIVDASSPDANGSQQKENRGKQDRDQDAVAVVQGLHESSDKLVGATRNPEGSEIEEAAVAGRSRESDGVDDAEYGRDAQSHEHEGGWAAPLNKVVNRP